jgi:hypothetical protein
MYIIKKLQVELHANQGFTGYQFSVLKLSKMSNIVTLNMWLETPGSMGKGSFKSNDKS